ncbi:hypothetical protein QTP88_002397 [Uroleucon formosanum]
MATTSSSKLRPKLVKDRFEYTILRKNLNDIRWKCSVITCVGKISTNLIKPYTIFTKFVSHQHDPKQLDKITFYAVNNAKTEMKQCAINNKESTNQILLSITHGCSKVCSNLGNPDALCRTIRRA